MKAKIKENAITKSGKINHHFINRLTNKEINEIINLTSFCPIDISVQIRIKLLIDNENKFPECKVCGDPVREHNKGLHLLDTCSKKCDYNLRVKTTKQSNTKKYGVSSTNKLKNVKEKQKNSMLDKYGVTHYTKSNDMLDKSKQTKLERYGDENYNNHKQSKQTKLERYGDENYNNYEQYVDTCIERYGVNHVMQSKEIFEKQQLKCYGSKKYKHLYYRGSYELLFIKEFEKYFDINDLVNCFPIKYKLNGNDKIYYPDFLIKNRNIIIEIKSSWTYDNNGKNLKLRAINDEKWDAANNLKNYSFIPLKSKDEIKLYFELTSKNII